MTLDWNWIERKFWKLAVSVAFNTAMILLLQYGGAHHG